MEIFEFIRQKNKRNPAETFGPGIQKISLNVLIEIKETEIKQM